MTRIGNLVSRVNWWFDVVVPVAVAGFAWAMGWGPWVILGALVASRIVTEVLRPRRPGRWTE